MILRCFVKAFRAFRTALFGLVKHLSEFIYDDGIIILYMRPAAVDTVLNALFGVYEIAAALRPQQIQRTVTEEAVELVLRHTVMAGKILAFPV